MQVVVHQTVAMADPPESFDHPGQRGKKAFAILVIEKDLAPRVPARGDMLDGTGKFNAKGAGRFQTLCTV